MIWATKRREWTVAYEEDLDGEYVQQVVVVTGMKEAREFVDYLITHKRVKTETIRIGQTGSVIIDRSK